MVKNQQEEIISRENSVSLPSSNCLLWLLSLTSTSIQSSTLSHPTQPRFLRPFIFSCFFFNPFLHFKSFLTDFNFLSFARAKLKNCFKDIYSSMASTALSQSLFSTFSPVSNKGLVENVSLPLHQSMPRQSFFKQSLCVSRSQFQSKKNAQKNFVTHCSSAGSESSNAETPIELSMHLYIVF